MPDATTKCSFFVHQRQIPSDDFFVGGDFYLDFYLLSCGAFRDAPQSVEQRDEFLHRKGQRHVFWQGYAHPPDGQAGTDVHFEEFAAFELLCRILTGHAADAHSAAGEFEH